MDQKAPAVQSASSVATMPPPHWEYYRGSLEESILKMYRSPLPHISPSSNHRALMIFRSYMLRTLKLHRGRIDVINVKQVENPLLYRRYITRRHEIALAAEGRQQPIVEIGKLPGESDVHTNTYGKCSCFLLLSQLNSTQVY